MLNNNNYWSSVYIIDLCSLGLQAQKSYVKKSIERDQAELALKSFNGHQGKEKDFERVRLLVRKEKNLSYKLPKKN